MPLATHCLIMLIGHPPSSQRNYTQITFDQYIAKIQQEPKLTMKKTPKHPKPNSNHKINIHSTWNNKKQNPQKQNTKLPKFNPNHKVNICST